MGRRFAQTMVALVTACAIACPAAWAQAQPLNSRPITLVVPYPAGGVTDAMARLIGEAMQRELGQTIIVEDVGGGSGAIGVGRVARASPDGSTLLLGNVETNVTNVISQPLNFDVFKDFDAVAMMPSYPYLIVSKNDVPAKTLPELIEWLRKSDGAAFQGTVGAGTIQHLCGLHMQEKLKARWSFVPYRGGAAALQDLIGGRFDIMCTPTGGFLPQVRAGNLRAYAVTAKTRTEAAPEIPTVDEAGGGLEGFYIGVWNAMWAPKGTPPALIARYNAAANKALADPVLRNRIIDLGLDMPPATLSTPRAVETFHHAEADLWWPIMRQAMGEGMK